jgi:hypothetical protein
MYWSLQHLSNAIWAVKRVFLGGALYKSVLYKVRVKVSPKIASHKIQWLQFVNKNIVGLQSWRSYRQFQIPITPTISILQLRFGVDCNFGLASTAICERGIFSNIIGWRVIVGVDLNLKGWMHWCELHYAVFGWKIWIGLEFLTIGNLEIDPKPEGFAFRVGWWLNALCRESR